MKYALILCLLISGLVQSQNLDKFLWKKRIIVLFSKENSDSKLEEQYDLLSRYSNELAERSMIILTPSNQEKAAFTNRFGLHKDFKGLILIGKDGGLKFEKGFIVNPETLFSLVDTMPMRKADMKSAQKNPN